MTYILMIAFVIMLILVAIVDNWKMEIPNGFVIIIAMIAIMAMVFQDDISLTNRLIGMVCVSLPLLIITMIIPNAFGGGDIKLMAASGFYLGWQLTLLSFLFAVLAGGIYGIGLLVTKKKERKEHFAFGPFLCGGMVISLFLGQEIINWYLSMM